MAFNAWLTALGLVFLVSFVLSARRARRRKLFAQRHGCQAVARSLNREPFLGLDALPSTFRAVHQHRILQQSCELYAKHGTTFTVKELTRRAILTIEPENIKTVLAHSFQDYGLSHRLEAFRPLLGEGIFDTDGEHWKHSRALIRPSFVRDQIADLTRFESTFQDLLKLLPRNGTTVVDLLDPFFCYTMDAATEFLFGESTGTLTNMSDGIGFAEAFHYAQRAVIRRAMLGPLNLFFPDAKSDDCNEICRSLARKYVDAAYRSLEARHVDGVEHSSTQQHERQIISRELAARTADKQRVLDEVMNLLLAGRDTTASLLSNMFFMIAKDGKIWSRLRIEVAALGGRLPTYAELNGFKYVQCCINECGSLCAVRTVAIEFHHGMR